MPKTILVTGAGGFVGSHLVRALVAAGSSTVYGNVYGSGNALQELLPASQIISGDLTDPDFTQSLITRVKPQIIYHLAALSVVQDSIAKAGEVLTSNLRLQYNLLETVRLNLPGARIVAICSANEYGLVKPEELPISEDVPLRPLNPYAVSKAAQDLLAYQYFLAHQLDVVRLRPFNHTGEGQTTDFIIPSLVRQFVEIAAGRLPPQIEVGNLESVRDFTDVLDMVQAYILAADQAKGGEVYNIGSGVGYSVRQIIELLTQISGTEVKVIQKTARVRVADVPVLLANSTKFNAATGWKPTHPLDATLTRVYNYMKEQNVER